MSVLLVTVNYLDHSVDLGLPAELPISSFLPMLPEICGLAQSGTQDSAEEWELARLWGTAFPLTDSLESWGVLDGAHLVLRVAAATDAEASWHRLDKAYVPAYLSINADPDGPIVNWIRDDLFTV